MGRSSSSNASLQRLQNGTLEAIARGEPLVTIAQRICRDAERLAPDVICTILTVDAQGSLHPIAAPSLPDAYSRALEGVQIGPHSGSCGTAAYLGAPVEVVDIANDPRWRNYKALALPLGLLACWSSPIKAQRDGHVVGTFAFYYRSKRGPAELERKIVEHCVDLCSIAIEHDEAQRRIHHLAFFDALTGLPNRAQFIERATRELAALQAGQAINVLAVDLDDFKGINDSLGHRVGDLLLEAVAQRLAACMEPDAFVARVGGDEFAVIQRCADARVNGSLLAQKIIAVVDDPFEIDDHRIGIGASIGIARATSADEELADLSRRADLALYEAKATGRCAWRLFVPEMEIAVQSRRGLKQDLRNALDAREFSLVYQPIIVLASNALAAVEALVRWQHPRHGSVPPAVFVPIIEEMGLIDRLGDWILREACAAAAGWPRAIKVGVNLSPLQFGKPGFVLDVISALHQAGLAPEQLDLEVTESALLARDVATRRGLNELHDYGVRLSLDDFGTGYSSLQLLRAFPFDKIKIDMSFVRDIGMDADSSAIIRAVIALARDLGMRTVAEGVETREQCDWLMRHGCSEGQGYYFGRPMSGADLQVLLDRPSRSEELIMPRSGQPQAQV